MQQANSILQLCARLETHAEHQTQLIAACTEFEAWNTLLVLAEEQGMGPLLSRHLTFAGISSPTVFLRGLKFLSLRHRQANTLLMKTLGEILTLFESAGIKSLVLKGAALCNTLYPEIGLRPMRDIDLLLDKEDVEHAHTLLQNAGFCSSSVALPKDYYHLQPLLKKDAGMEISIELHHGLFPQLPPFYNEFSFNESFEKGKTFVVNGVSARALANEEMLYHLFEHGFHPPLTYESCKLISAADIIGLVEKNVTTLDWGKINKKYPQISTSLSAFHYLSPWSEKVLPYIHVENSVIPAGVGDAYSGWPRQKFWDAIKGKRTMAILKDTFFPSRWWCMLYYSTKNGVFAALWNRFVEHPVHLLRWVKICNKL
ncbi:MAG: hypothetical protein DSY80_06750 [Desulfocapsa sp.]|nr:MAG: hypothetical protein DSY80_06750 [Desulfocapsa sp.]